MSRPSLEKKPSEIAAMFDDVARRYDLTNDVLTMGLHRLWRRATVAAVDAKPGQRVLDLAAGTGCSSEPYAEAGVDVVAADFSLGMLRQGKRDRPHLGFTAADALALPFADDSFDAVVISYALRNLVDPAAGVREMLRVTKPGGRLVVLEFSHPTFAPLRTVYTDGALRAVPVVARAVSSSPDSYVYLAESIRAWPEQEDLALMIGAQGWEGPAWRNLSGGIVAIHRGFKPHAI